MRRRARDAFQRQTEAAIAAEVVRRTQAMVGKPNGRLTWKALADAIAEVLTTVRQEGLLDPQAKPMMPRVLCLVSVEGGNVHLTARLDASERRVRRQPAKVLPGPGNPGFHPRRHDAKA